MHAILVLSELGELDAAFSVIDGLLLRRGQLITQSRTGEHLTPAQDPIWRQTMWLFTPATKALRADPRFGALTAAIGLDDYWRSRGIEPDDRPAPDLEPHLEPEAVLPRVACRAAHG